MWEWIIKIAITVTIILVSVGMIRWIWTHQIDARATVSGILRSAVEPKGIATRDPNKLYQNGEPVADVVGEVEESDTNVLFHRLTNTGNLDREATFQYARRTLHIVKIGKETGMLTNLLPSGSTEIMNNVLDEVECEEVK